MTILTFYDAAWPPADPPATDGVAFYIGGDTPHIWAAEEISRQTARYRLPVFVRSNPDSAAVTADVTAAVTALHQIGAPRGVLVAWDLETAIDPGYILAVYRALTAAGYKLIVYGTQADVLRNDNPDGLYWGADWTGKRHLAAHDQITQYVSFQAYDSSIALSSLPFWDTQLTPAHSGNWQEKLMQSLPALRQGATGEFVRTVQGLCCARGHALAIDGSFGPQTELAVRAVQAAAHITVDGIVGQQQTWPALLGV